MWRDMLASLMCAALLESAGAVRGRLRSASGGLVDIQECISVRELKLVCPAKKNLQIVSAFWNRQNDKDCARQKGQRILKTQRVASYCVVDGTPKENEMCCKADATPNVDDMCSGRESCIIPVGFTGCPKNPFRQIRVVYDCWDSSDDEDLVSGPSEDINSASDGLTTEAPGETTIFNGEVSKPLPKVRLPTLQNTAWDILCLSGTVGEFRHWGQVSCNSLAAVFGLKLCHRLDVKCDFDERVQDITLWWRVTGAVKVMRIPKTAKPISTEDHYHRFFLASEGCPHGNNNEDCDLPWAAFNEPREVSSLADVTRRFLVYDSRIPGEPLMQMQTNKYHADFWVSDFTPLGTGLPLPEVPIFAGSSGTDCGISRQCAEPPHSEAPVLSTEFKVTSKYIIESPTDPGHLVLMSNHNEANVMKTYVVEFSAKSR